jgi:hypothetical protein
VGEELENNIRMKLRGVVDVGVALDELLTLKALAMPILSTSH